MLNSKRLMAYLLTLLVSFAFIACDGDDCDETAGDAAGEEMSEEEADDSCAEGGDAGGDPAGEVPAGDEGGTSAGEEGGVVAGDTAGDMAGETPVVAYNFVVVQDQTEDVNDDGTPGVDVCEISVNCGDEELTEDERNIISVAFKNVVGSRRASWRVISLIERKENKKGALQNAEKAKNYKRIIEKELTD